MNIYKCGGDDLGAVTEFYGRVTAYLDAHVNYPKWTHGEYPGRASISAAIVEGAQHICVSDGKIIGAFVLNSDPQGDYSSGEWTRDIADGEYMVIHALAADPGIYRAGIGSKMVDYCVETAKHRGFKALRLDVVPDNFPARRLYESKGFTFAGEKDLRRGIEAIPAFALYEMNF